MQYLFVLLLMFSVVARAEEVPLDNCKRLPLAKVTVGKKQYQFLLDTGATSTLLNLKSFSSFDSTEVTMETWNGSFAAAGREVVLHDLTMGDHPLYNLKLLAVDLTPLERSCQKRVDGVLGADLIEKLGMKIDLKNHVASLAAKEKMAEAQFAELNRQQELCGAAFNNSDAKTFSECLDPEIVLMTFKGDYRGRPSVMKYLEKYFHQSPPTVLSLRPREYHAVGDVIWEEYDLEIMTPERTIQAKGTSLFHKTGEKWLIMNMNHSMNDPKNESISSAGPDQR
ncbi:MAG TPA: aspartyl protease family protein [Candidatus Angelobacter sp.]|nr:aspartyl protease family protein [Candidatus Angelobacter sp.]